MDVVHEESTIVSLRRATRASHDTLETILQLASPLSRRRYVEALVGFEMFLSSWEPRIAAALPAAQRDWFASRSRYHLLRLDLQRLDVQWAASRKTTDDCAHAVQQLELVSTAAIFGSIYVLEGSALGGQVIARTARETLGFDSDSGAAYFNGPHRDTASGWGDFRARLEREVEPGPRAREEACNAARQTFDALIVTFTAVCGSPDGR